MVVHDTRGQAEDGAASGPIPPDGQPGPYLQDLLDTERRPVPVSLRHQSQIPLRSGDIAKERYYSREFHDLEVEKVWKKTWQMVCREEELAEVGDSVVYDVADQSALVVRCAPDRIKAFPNACLHRGAQLRTGDGNVSELRCAFHGFCWTLNGELKDVPCAWDFPDVTAETFALPEFLVDSWEGFVFINMDTDAPPLREYLGGVVDQVAEIARPMMRDRWKAAHVIKPVRANWKVALEAFIESFHTVATHPQCLPWGGDANTQYDVYPDEPHWSRMLVPCGIPSPHVAGQFSESDVAASLFEDLLGYDALEVAEGQTAREAISESFRTLAKLGMGYDATDVTDCQILDTLAYFVFPNFMPFLGLLQALTYRFRPYGNDPDMCLMEIMLFYPVPEGSPRPPSAKPTWLGVDDDATAAPELGNFAPFLNQDLSNLERVQRGLHAMTKPGVTLGGYQESRIRHFHQTLDDYIGGAQC